MKKLLCILVLACLVMGGVFAIDLSKFPSPMKPGSFMISPTVHLGGSGFSGLGAVDDGFHLSIAATVAADYCLPIPLTVGLETGAAFSTEKDSDILIPILARVAWHVNFGVKNLDPYVGAKIGYTINTGDFESYKGSLYDTSSGGLSFGFNVGVRYFFTPMIGVFGELGYDRYKWGEVNYKGIYGWGSWSWSAYYYTFFHAGVTIKF